MSDEAQKDTTSGQADRLDPGSTSSESQAVPSPAGPITPSPERVATTVTPDYERYAFAGGASDDSSHGEKKNLVPQYGMYAESDVEDVTHTDKVRKTIVVWLLGLLSGTIALGITGVATTRWTGVSVADVRSVFDIAFTAVVALVSTAVGFYFASEARKQGPPKG